MAYSALSTRVVLFPNYNIEVAHNVNCGMFFLSVFVNSKHNLDQIVTVSP
jgi:hypothetical protein